MKPDTCHPGTSSLKLRSRCGGPQRRLWCRPHRLTKVGCFAWQLAFSLITTRPYSTQNPTVSVMIAPTTMGKAIFRRKSDIEVEKYSKDTEMQG